MANHLIKSLLFITLSGGCALIGVPAAHATEAQTVVQETGKCEGTVTDASGEPIPGATVKVPGTSLAASTDINGRFTLNGVKNGTKIHINTIGYTPVDVVWNGSPVEVVLEEDNKVLDEVVVVGYGVQKKVNLSGAVATVDTKTIENRPVVNVGQALQGTVANLNVSIGSGQANDSPSFNIRGTTSLNGGSPLIVIDGVVASNWMLNNMNPNDIESISVLKDAASAAIYGSRAAFGVILVTTRTGSSDKVNVTYSGNVSMRQNVFKPKIISDSYEVAKIRNIMSYPWYNLYDEDQLAYAKQVSEGTADPYYLNPDGTYTYFGSTDWVKEAYKDHGLATTHSISISGNSERVNYLVSGGYSFTDGIIKYGTDKHKRFTTRTKVNVKLTDWWQLGSNMSLISTNYDRPSRLGSSYFWEVNRCAPLDVITNPDGSWTKKGAETLGILSEGGRTTQRGMNLLTMFNTKIDIIKDMLWVNGIFSYDYDKDRNRGHYLPLNYYTGPETQPISINPVTSAYTDSYESQRYTYDAYATFSKKFGDRHDLSAVLGFNQENYRYEAANLSRKDLISTSLPTPGLATGDMTVGESITTWAVRSAYGRINYIFDDKYIAEFNGRYDGTSRFPKNDRYTFNPSGSVAWVLSREKFMESLSPILSFAKIRYSYGTLGNQDVGAYAYIPTMGSGKIGQILDGEQPVYVGAPGLVSGSLTWEKVTTSNIGLELNFFNNRLSLVGDYYNRWTKDMLTSGMPLPNVLGTGVPQANAADLKTYGWELTVKWNSSFMLGSHSFNYNVGFNLSDAQSKITKFDNPDKLLSAYYVGRKIGEIWGYTTEGFFTSQEDIDNHADQSRYTSYPGVRPLEPGDIKLADINGDGVVNYGNNTMIRLNGRTYVKGDAGYDEAKKNPESEVVPINSVDNHGDLRVIGNSQSRYRFGITAGAEWNGFDLSMFFQGVGKRDYNPSGDLYFWGIYAQPWTNITYGNYHDHWTEENPNAYFPRMKAYVAEQSGYEAGLTQTRYLQNAAYIRLKNLTFGYTLPRQLTGKAGVERVRIYFSGDNMFTHSGLYKHYNVDPEGLGGQSYPLQRSYSLGININF